MTSQYYLKNTRTSAQIDLPNGQTIVGRDEACNIPIPDQLLSRKHAQFLIEGENIAVEDLNSTNGTEVNYSAIASRKALRLGDVITFGEHSFQLQCHQNKEDTTILKDTRVNQKGSYIIADTNSDQTSFRQSFALPISWTHNDRQQFTNKYGHIDEQQLIEVIRSARIPKTSANAALIVVSSKPQWQVFALLNNKKQWALGRTDQCEVYIDDSTISKLHAKIILKNDTWYLADNKSLNGVAVNAKPQTQVVIEHNDIISVGDVDIIFRKFGA